MCLLHLGRVISLLFVDKVEDEQRFCRKTKRQKETDRQQIIIIIIFIIIIIIFCPITARVFGAPQMISQPVSSIFFLFSTALWDLANSRPVHSLMLSSLLLSLPCLLPPFTVPCKMVLARPDERESRAGGGEATWWVGRWGRGYLVWRCLSLLPVCRL